MTLQATVDLLERLIAYPTVSTDSNLELILDLSLESDSMLTFFRVSLSESGRQVEECVRVPLPARSLVAIYGSARFDWEHAILAYDIVGQRTGITFRTLQEDLRNTEKIARSFRRSMA